MFFYNPSCKQSVWERPKDLENRADVEKAVRTPPEQLLGTVILPPETSKVELVSPATKKRSESDSSSDSETSSKRQKLDGTFFNFNSEVMKLHIFLAKIDLTVSASDAKAEEAMDAEMKAAKERALVPLEQRIKQFKEMLREKDVSIYLYNKFRTTNISFTPTVEH